MSYKNLDIWNLSRRVVIEIHAMSLNLPAFEKFEVGQQIRRSSKTIKACIVEGYGRRRYKNDWIKFIVYALSSTDETTDHLETLWDTKSLTDKILYESLKADLSLLAKKLTAFLRAVEDGHISTK